MYIYTHLCNQSVWYHLHAEIFSHLLNLNLFSVYGLRGRAGTLFGHAGHLCCELPDQAGIDLEGQLAPEVELRAEGLGLEGSLQRGDCQVQLLIGREEGEMHEGVWAQLLCSA